MSKNQTTTITILIVTAFLIGGAVLWNNSQSASEEQTSDTTALVNEPTSDDESAGSDAASNYKAGEYSATGNYQSPDGSQTISIRLTINADGTVTDTSATKGANGRESSEYQSRFIGGYKAEVVGKDIDTLTLDSVSGSSLTPQGFNDALEKIKQEAKA